MTCDYHFVRAQVMGRPSSGKAAALAQPALPLNERNPIPSSPSPRPPPAPPKLEREGAERSEAGEGEARRCGPL